LTKARVNADNVTADIAGITAGTGITGGGTSGTVTITNSMATAIDAAGDLIYGTGSDAFTRLGLGTASQILRVNSGATAPEWVTPAAAGSMTLLSTTTLSGASTTISGISGSYTHLFGVVYGVTNATANGNLIIRPNGANNTSFTGYAHNTQFSGTNTGWELSMNYAMERTVANNAWQFQIFNYAQTSFRKPVTSNGLWVNQFSPSGPPQAGFNLGGIHTTAAITSLEFVHSGGNLSSGTVLLYGVN
jgi:hypothetical protein